MADDLEATCNDPLPAYDELTDKVAEDGVDSLRQLLDKISNVLRRLDVADALVHLQVSVTEEMIRGSEVNSSDAVPRVSQSCKRIENEGHSKAETGVVSLSADTLLQAFPSDHAQRCRMVYERCRNGHRCAGLVDDQSVLAFPVDEVNVNDLIVDPHPLECYGEALYTPPKVKAMLSDD
ncbi:hypothetical protein Hanom_Chr03g00191341 [Helianthus anomalus]